MPAGRPSKYNPDYVEQAHSLCLLGATDKQLADSFDVSEQTLNAWKKEFPEFLESLRSAKVLADAKVTQSLYQQALDGNVTAQIFWLKNRQSHLFRDKQEVEHTVKHKVDNVSDEELENIARGSSYKATGEAKGAEKPH